MRTNMIESALTNKVVANGPPATVLTAQVMGVSLSTTIQVLTILYLVLQIGWFIYSKFFRKDKRDEQSRND